MLFELVAAGGWQTCNTWKEAGLQPLDVVKCSHTFLFLYSLVLMASKKLYTDRKQKSAPTDAEALYHPRAVFHVVNELLQPGNKKSKIKPMVAYNYMLGRLFVGKISHIFTNL